MKWNKETTIGEMYEPAMEITDQKEADKYLEALVQHNMETWGQTREEAESIQRSNLGYFAGYYDAETMNRVNKLFCTSHPIFGEKIPTAKEAFKIGEEMGANIS